MPIITVELTADGDMYHPSVINRTPDDVSIKGLIESRLNCPDQTLEIDNTSGFLTNEGHDPLLTPKIEPVSHTDTEETEKCDVETNENIQGRDVSLSKKSDLLEYLIRNDGSVVCKMCGEILQSRIHWYRHKYKFHMTQNVNPTPIFQCEQCNVYFKSKKGYIGHTASKHPENYRLEMEGAPPVTMVTTGTQVTPPLAAPTSVLVETATVIKQEPVDHEIAIPKTEVLNYNRANTSNIQVKEVRRYSKSNKETWTRGPEWEERRSREDQLVADIIARVRRECEATGGGGNAAARRGYSRRART